VKIVRNTIIAALLAAGVTATSASAGTLTYQGVTFTSSWTGNVLSLEIDAAHPTGDWLTATTLGALQLKDIGTFDSVSLTSAPAGAMSWTLSSNELSANGCDGGSHVGSSLCYSGTHVALTDDMLFQFTFTGTNTDFTSPHLKVLMFDGAGGDKVGSLLSQNIPVASVPEPETYAMMFGGLAALAALARRRNKRA
jgi:hypothetical protein